MARRILDTLTPAELKAARDLLGYLPASAGRYMTPRYVAVRGDDTAAEALAHVRKAGKEQETLNILYVVGDNGKFLKELRLGTLVLAEPGMRVADIRTIPERWIIPDGQEAWRQEGRQLPRLRLARVHQHHTRLNY